MHNADWSAILLQESSVAFQVSLSNEKQIRLNAYLVYGESRPIDANDSNTRYRWVAVSRANCRRKNCEGQVRIL